MRRLGAVVSFLACLWLTHAAAAEVPVRLDRVEIAGNKRVEDEAIRVRLKAAPRTLLDETVVDADIRAIYQMGFFRTVEADLSRINGEWVLTYRVTERPFVREVKIEGEKKIDKEEIEAALKIRPNMIFDPQRAEQGIKEAKQMYDKKGFLDAKIEYSLEPVDPAQPDTVIVRYKVDEGKVVRIHTLEFEGNRAFTDRQLRKLISTKKQWFLSFITQRGNLDREVIKTDMERLTAYYYDNGYIDVRIDEPAIEREEKGLKVTIKIDEGAIYQFGEVKLEGDLLPAVEQAAKNLGAVKGQTFRASKLREDVNLLSEVYGDVGYAFVNVTPQTDVDARERRVDVTYQISKGPEIYIDRIEITGNTKTRDKVIRRELEVEEQERFTGSKLRRSQLKLRRLGYFEEVNITTRKADREDRLDLIVDVKEASTGSFAAGAGISSGESFLFNLRLAEINLFGRGQKIVLNADFGAISRNISLSFTEPYLFDTNLTAGIDAYNWELEFDEFTRGGTGGGIRTLYPLWELGVRDLLGFSLIDTRVGVEYRIENAEISDVRTFSSLIASEQGKFLTSSIIPRLFRDTRNHPFDPTEGSLQDVSIEFAGIGGDSKFLKAESRARWYYPFWRSPRLGTFTFSTGWTFGYGIGLADRRELPLFERYFPGGINSIRGFETRSLGPRVGVFDNGVETRICPLGEDSCGRFIRRDVIGGSQQLIFNNEIIFPLIEALGVKGVLFFDAGEAFAAADGIDFTDMRLAVGTGVRWLSPIGPLRIEVGFPLNPRVGDERQAVLFSFGGPP